MALTESMVFSDTRHRYALALSKRPKGCPGVLDVGGYRSRAEIVRSLDGEVRYESLNVGSAWYDGETSDVLYDGIWMPFRDRSVPFVMSVDTLEHIPAAERGRFVGELCRIASSRVVVVVPFCDGEPEERTFERYAAKWGIVLKPSLSEHLRFGLSTSDELRGYAGERPFMLSFATPRKFFWDMMTAQLLNNAVLGTERSREPNSGIRDFAERMLLATRDDLSKGEAYRAVLVMDREPEDRDRIS